MKTASLIPQSVPFFFLPVRKPCGPTSHDMVAKIRRCLGRHAKVGHMGTLDPFASGVLLLGVGKATKFASEVFRLEKSYRGIISLGHETDTLDATGTVVDTRDVGRLDEPMLKEIAGEFLGEQSQMPPVFSAKKIQGQRSYHLARQKKDVTLQAHTIRVFCMELTLQSQSTVEINVTCSTGTYVRSLARDIAKRLGTCGFLSELERVSIGPVNQNMCLDPNRFSLEFVSAYALPVARLLPRFPEILLPDHSYSDLRNGRTHVVNEPLPSQFLGVVGQGEGFRAVFRCEFDTHRLAIVPKMLCYEVE